jgi:hypothetical protein
MQDAFLLDLFLPMKTTTAKKVQDFREK